MQNQSGLSMGETLFKETTAVGRTLWLQSLQASQNPTEKGFSFTGRNYGASKDFREGRQAVRLSRQHDRDSSARFLFVAGLLEQAVLYLGAGLSLEMSQHLRAYRKEGGLSQVWSSQVHG